MMMNNQTLLYYDYLSKFSKPVSRVQENGRLQNFINSFQFIQDYNTAISDNTTSYFLRPNQFSDLSASELNGLFHSAYSAYEHSIHQDLLNSSEYSFKPLSQRQNKRRLNEFYHSFSWATSNNPTKKAITTSVRNQGMCGGCWAFVSTSCTEASIAKNIDHPISLSVQELIDCDNEYDRACNGGNPVNAFRYIMSHGLTTSDRYPLTSQTVQYQKAQECYDSSNDPVRGSIKGFMTITPYRQDLMLQALYSQGPLSVGLCGTDQTFLFYGGGIYNPESCCSTLNHAMLIVGYGTDETTGLDYWILQNSWGSLWGEQGYMRMIRSSDMGPGLCGIALTPSVAIGGYLLRGMNKSSPTGYNGDYDNTPDHTLSPHNVYNWLIKWSSIITSVEFWQWSNWKAILMILFSTCFLIASFVLIWLVLLECVFCSRKRRKTSTNKTQASNSSSMSIDEKTLITPTITTGTTNYNTLMSHSSSSLLNRSPMTNRRIPTNSTSYDSTIYQMSHVSPSRHSHFNHPTPPPPTTNRIQSNNNNHNHNHNHIAYNPILDTHAESLLDESYYMTQKSQSLQPTCISNITKKPITKTSIMTDSSHYNMGKPLYNTDHHYLNTYAQYKNLYASPSLSSSISSATTTIVTPMHPLTSTATTNNTTTTASHSTKSTTYGTSSNKFPTNYHPTSTSAHIYPTAPLLSTTAVPMATRTSYLAPIAMRASYIPHEYTRSSPLYDIYPDYHIEDHPPDHDGYT